MFTEIDENCERIETTETRERNARRTWFRSYEPEAVVILAAAKCRAEEWERDNPWQPAEIPVKHSGMAIVAFPKDGGPIEHYASAYAASIALKCAPSEISRVIDNPVASARRRRWQSKAMHERFTSQGIVTETKFDGHQIPQVNGLRPHLHAQVIEPVEGESHQPDEYAPRVYHIARSRSIYHE